MTAAAANTFTLEILTAEGRPLQQTVVSAVLPTSDGLIGVLAGHTPMMALLQPGTVQYRGADGKSGTARVGNGVIDIGHERVLVLTTTHTPPARS